MQRAHPRHLLAGERHRRVFAQRRPFRARKDAVGRKAVVRGALLHRDATGCPRIHISRKLGRPGLRSRLRDAFSCSPDCLVRSASAASTPRARSRGHGAHQQVIDEIGGFRDQSLAVFSTAASTVSIASSPSFLAQCATPAVEQLPGIGDIGARLRALAHALFEVMEGEIRHHFCSALAYHLRDARGEGHRRLGTSNPPH